jgi:lysophospholipase L1-like esterase
MQNAIALVIVLLSFVAPSPLLDYLKTRNLTIVCVGDSLTEGMVLVQLPDRRRPAVHFSPYSASLEELVRPIVVANAGKSGEKSHEILARLPKIFNSTSTIGLAIILAGTNDLVHQHITAADSHAHLDAIHSAFWSQGAFTLAITLPALSWIQHLPASISKYNSVNEHLREMRLKKSNKLVGVLDLARKFIPQTAPENLFFWGIDNAHLSDAGYKRVGELLFELLKNATVTH